MVFLVQSCLLCANISVLARKFSQNLDRIFHIFRAQKKTVSKPILHFLRTRKISLPSGVAARDLYDEAEFYNIRQLSDRLKLCAQLGEESCGGIHFYERLSTPEK